MKCYEIDLETLFVKDGDESLSEAFDDRIDFREVRKTMKKMKRRTGRRRMRCRNGVNTAKRAAFRKKTGQEA
jgi:hypothetical protein